MTYIILAALAWWLIKGDIPAFCDFVARKAAYVYAAGVVTREAVEYANNWLADRASGRISWIPSKPSPAPLNAHTVFGEGVIVLTDEALTAECLAFEAPAKPAKRRRTRAVKVATGG
jgi:hypothetical protein